MIINNSKRYRRSKYIAFSLCFFLIIIFTMASCSGFSNVKLAAKIATGKVAEKLKRNNLKKKIGIGTFENRTFFPGHGIEKSLQKSIRAGIEKKCSDVVLENLDISEGLDLFKTLRKNTSGRIDNLALARFGRTRGLNAIVTGGLLDVREKQEERGLFWFRDVHDFVEIVIAVEVYDTETGAKLLDDSYLYESKLSISEVELIRENRPVEIPTLSKAVLRATKTLSEKICLAVLQSKWKGFIGSISDDKIVLASGSEVGLQSGDILEVNDNAIIINGVNGESFYLPGQKKGEIKLTTVFPDRSEAVAVSNNGIRTGYSVQLKN